MDQLSLLPHPKETLKKTVNEAREEVMAAIAKKADELRAAFSAEADAFVLGYLATRPDGAAGEEISLACKRAGIVPHDDRAFGPVYMRLARAGRIKKIGTVRRERGHGTAGGNIWGLA